MKLDEPPTLGRPGVARCSRCGSWRLTTQACRTCLVRRGRHPVVRCRGCGMWLPGRPASSCPACREEAAVMDRSEGRQGR